MAEVKSAIELAMERTRNLVMSDEEKKAQQEKDAEARIRGILRRYVDGAVGTRDVKEELDAIRADERLKRVVFIEGIINALDLAGDNEQLIDLLKAVNGGLDESLLNDLETIRERFTEQMDRKKILVKERIVQRMDRIGISGTGVEPNIDAWDEWKEAEEETKAAYKRHLNDWKEKILKLTPTAH